MHVRCLHSLSGDECVAALASFGVTVTNHKTVLRQLDICTARPTDADKLEPHLTSVAGAALEALQCMLDFIFSNNMKHVNDYRMVVRVERSRERGNGTVTSLCFWCLSPSVAFSRLASAARSIILTSGTLSPMDSFASELGVPFSIKLEAPHVIAPSQVIGCIVSRSPPSQGEGLITVNYASSQTQQLQDCLGDVALGIVERVPDGVLMFFPSYALMDKVVARWKETGLWRQLLKHKQVVVEPKMNVNRAFDKAMKRFVNACQKSNEGRAKQASAVKGQQKQEKEKSDSGKKKRRRVAIAFENDDAPMDTQASGEHEEEQATADVDPAAAAVAAVCSTNTQTGGLFLAVARGKLSEGIDFAGVYIMRLASVSTLARTLTRRQY